jgi:choline dehydrogenase-like flavoprotein
MHRKTLEEADNIVLILGSHVTDIVGGGNGNASEVNVVHASGLEFSIPARTFVLATGGVENAKLLLNSANLLDRRSADCVGRFFQEHWYYVFNSEVPDDGSGDLGFYLVGEGRTIDELGEKRRFIDGAHVWGQLVVSDSELVKNQIPGLAIWFTEGGAPDALHNFRHPRQYRGEWHELVLNAVKEGGGIAAYLWRRLLGRRNPSRRFTMFAQVEQIPSRQSRVCLSKHLDQWGWPDVEIATELDLAERRMHAVGLRLVARELGLDGDDLVSKMERKYANSQFGYFWHHLGTTRMGEDPSRSVVDRNCRVHGTENLYVAGGSVFVTSGTAAPTLTIVALALRLASHLRSSLAAVD